jgi:flagellar biosynthetic protein FliR
MYGPVNNPEVYTKFLCLLLIFVRMIAFFVQAPIWGSAHIPKPILAATAFIISLVIYPHVPITDGLREVGGRMMASDFWPLGVLIFSQFAVGLVIGYTSYLIMAAMQYGAELLDVQMGLSVASSFDPSSHGSVNMIRRWAFYLAMILYVLLNGHIKMLECMAYSYQVIPLTGFWLDERLFMDILHKTGYVFTLGMQISAPVVGALFITQVGLGLLARVAPQMNVFMISFPLNILVGMSLLSASLLLMRDRLSVLFDENLKWCWAEIRMMGAHAPGVMPHV